MPNNEKTLAKMSMNLPRLIALKTPSGIPIKIAIPIDIKPNCKVIGSLDRIWSITGFPWINEKPKSPTIILPIHQKYCSSSGLSRPSSFRICARSSSLFAAVTPIMLVTMSPGTSRMSANVKKVTPNTTGTNRNILRRMYLLIKF